MQKIIILAAAGFALAGCAGGHATRTSANTVLIDVGAAPVCGPSGAAKVAAKKAAIETIKAGYDRYIIGGAASQSDVRTVTMPGQTNVTGQVYRDGTFRANTYYTPGPTFTVGSHNRQLSILMLKPGDPGFENGVDARQELGPDWAEVVRNGVINCL